MINVLELSKKYEVRKLEELDAESILNLCSGNAGFYRYTEARPTMEQVLNDLHITPPNIPMSDKYYVGFYEDKTLVAVMDLIDGYPDADIAYIGFFMMDPAYQGKQIGTSIISEVIDHLGSIGKTAVRLAIDKGNPQSTHFWKKNGFTIISEADVNGWTKLVAEKQLCRIGMVHRMNLDPDPYKMIKNGQKTIELRLYDEKRRKIRPNDEIVFTNNATGETLRTRVLKLHCFNSFEELYQTLPLLQCGYTEEDIDQAQASDMEQYYSKDDQAKYGVVGIELFLQKETIVWLE